MRIRIVQRPRVASVDGLPLDRFQLGCLYDVGTALGCLFLSEGWAEPVVNEEPALLVPFSQTASATAADPDNLIRERFPPYIPDEYAIAADRRRKHRR